MLKIQMVEAGDREFDFDLPSLAEQKKIIAMVKIICCSSFPED